uniref:PARP catalytic domain-containing protein n=1 Tax=Leptobrachium leishanense TaxID=445787 RepID=A0A8C5MTS9_9ANUR
MDPRTMANTYYKEVLNTWWQELDPGFNAGLLESDCPPDDGKIFVMYHGTTAAAAEQIIKNGFRQSADGMLGRGVYVSRDPNKAARYPLGDKSDQVILKLRVNVGKVIKIDQKNFKMQKTWHIDHGFDTAWVPPNTILVESKLKLEEDCVWDPKRIRVVGIVLAPEGHLASLQNMVSGNTVKHDNDLLKASMNFK